MEELSYLLNSRFGFVRILTEEFAEPHVPADGREQLSGFIMEHMGDAPAASCSDASVSRRKAAFESPKVAARTSIYKRQRQIPLGTCRIF